MIEDDMEIFMDDFSVFEITFDQYLKTLDKVLHRCKSSNLILN